MLFLFPVTENRNRTDTGSINHFDAAGTSEFLEFADDIGLNSVIIVSVHNKKL